MSVKRRLVNVLVTAIMLVAALLAPLALPVSIVVRKVVGDRRRTEHVMPERGTGRVVPLSDGADRAS